MEREKSWGKERCKRSKWGKLRVRTSKGSCLNLKEEPFGCMAFLGVVRENGSGSLSPGEGLRTPLLVFPATTLHPPAYNTCLHPTSRMTLYGTFSIALSPVGHRENAGDTGVYPNCFQPRGGNEVHSRANKYAKNRTRFIKCTRQWLYAVY